MTYRYWLTTQKEFDVKRLISLIIVVTVVAVALAVVAPPRSIAQDDQLVV